ncbi:undecaprenyl-diphosphate phosphatase [Isoalcanivorax beigongshangi]|uniref:Undecaprenyl-diphosphatase n=1 Tax=Isoalcanivorax beigongshangi TaxID=3238810 RepID=A0ABV4AF45_9GAMM
MDWIQAVVLAVIQGLTEFLPVSSSAHLILPSQLLGWQDQGLAFDVAIHLGTLIAVLWYYRNTLGAMVGGALRGVSQRQMNPDLHLGLMIVWATIPAVIFGFLFKDMVEQYARSAAVIGTTTILFGGLLWWADRRGSKQLQLAAVGLGIATLVGLAQALALIPGTSRSGITLTAALLLGLRRDDAAHFSFLLSIPVILGAIVLMSRDLVHLEQVYSNAQLAMACLVSALVAYASIGFFLRLVTRVGMVPFAIYRLVLGSVLLLMVLWPVTQL